MRSLLEPIPGADDDPPTSDTVIPRLPTMSLLPLALPSPPTRRRIRGYVEVVRKSNDLRGE
ncbi:hypothetical protein GCM10025866_08040 [Naasia aerilata]|uniref:Uncharacterized protein n=1 Tax=Naasia aerilata TaxID=1162966 RepID=A0ABN6XMT8_9MICO|nr:hypothetical protein GCM10025866_08040 [Naasia aerilata]